MKLKFLFPYWGSERMDPREFISFCVEQGFDGIEINLPVNTEEACAFRIALHEVKKENPNFKIIAQQVLPNQPDTLETYKQRLLERLDFIATFEPDLINSHTGKDIFTFEENCHLIQCIEKFEKEKGISVLHEIHRGRFTFHSATLLPYLDEFPQLRLTGDFSHWCLVSESMLDDQEHILTKVYPHIHHVHARVGFEQASQVSDPFAPEWESHVHRFLQLWKNILAYHQHHGRSEFTITPEFGPVPYMPLSPFDQKPLGDQTKINLKMKALLMSRLTGTL